MEKVRDYKDFLRQLSKFKRENSPTYTNFYLFGSKLEKLIDQGRLQAKQSEGAVCIIEDQGRYFQFYYCVHAEGEIPLLTTEKTCASWLIWNDRTKTEEVQASREKLRKAGFKPVARNIQYAMDIGMRADAIRRKLSAAKKKATGQGIELRFMEPEDYQELDALWHQCFEEYRIPDLGKELTELAAEKRILLACKADEKKQVVGSRFMDFQGKTVHTHKTCVSAGYRGLGLGKLLVLAGLEEALKRGCTRWLVEVDEGNTASEQMHFGAMGERLERTGTIAELYVR